jgi:hypothetical protein
MLVAFLIENEQAAKIMSCHEIDIMSSFWGSVL